MPPFYKTFPTLLLLSSLSLLGGIQAEVNKISLKNPDYNCVEGINYALSLVNFNDKDTNTTTSSSYTALCNSVYHTTSLALSTTKWCTKQEHLDSGWKRFSYYCEHDVNVIIPAREDLIANVDQSKVVEDVNTVDPGHRGKLYHGPIVLSEKAWKTGVKDETDEHIRHHGFGSGLYIFAVIVVLVGTINRIFALLIQKYVKPKNIKVPALFGYKHSQAFGRGFITIPTRLQSFFIFVYLLMNIIFMFVAYNVVYEDVNLYGDRNTQYIRYLFNRSGIMCFYKLPLLWLLAGRNDVVLWLTGRSFSTVSIFHRWVARIAILQAIVHSAGYLYLQQEYLSAESNEQYWLAGIVALAIMVLVIVYSLRRFREKSYEAFLILHISFALAILVAVYFPVNIWQGQYAPWIWACVAI